jgi:hypothetical protein
MRQCFAAALSPIAAELQWQRHHAAETREAEPTLMKNQVLPAEA